MAVAEYSPVIRNVGPSVCNDLPVDLRVEDDLTCFKSSLKPIFLHCLPKTQIPMFIDT